jgi:hypothetical protein
LIIDKKSPTTNIKEYTNGLYEEDKKKHDEKFIEEVKKITLDHKREWQHKERNKLDLQKGGKSKTRRVKKSKKSRKSKRKSKRRTRKH